MAFRKRISKFKSKKQFRKTSKHHGKNRSTGVMRGGVRL